MNDDNETPGENGGNDDRTEFIYARVEDLLDLVQLNYDLESSVAANEIFMTLLSYVGINLPGPFEEPLKSQMAIWHEVNAEEMAGADKKRPALKVLKFERPKKPPGDKE